MKSSWHGSKSTTSRKNPKSPVRETPGSSAGRTGGHPHGGMAVHAQAGGKDPPDRLVVLDQQHRSHPATITTPDPAPPETIAQLLVHQDRETPAVRRRGGAHGHPL